MLHKFLTIVMSFSGGVILACLLCIAVAAIFGVWVDSMPTVLITKFAITGCIFGAITLGAAIIDLVTDEVDSFWL